MHSFEKDGVQIFYAKTGLDEDSDAPLVVWGHGWGQSHAAFDVCTQALARQARHIVLDFPGFGQSPVPFDTIEQSWGSSDYAHAVADMLRSLSPNRKVVWIGHSFGARVGTQLGALYPDMIESMVFVAGAGLKAKRSVFKKMQLKLKVIAYKIGKKVTANKLGSAVLSVLGISASGKGSADYQKAGAMRGTLVKVVNEHLSSEASKIQCPVLLLYGDKDTETPPNIGQQYEKLIKNAKLFVLEGEDHYTVLDSHGSHQVILRIKEFIQQH